MKGGSSRNDASLKQKGTGRFHLFDSWQVEAPRYTNVCPQFDHHFSCFGRAGPFRTEVKGVVGEAVVRSFVHYLLHVVPLI